MKLSPTLSPAELLAFVIEWLFQALADWKAAQAAVVEGAQAEATVSDAEPRVGELSGSIAVGRSAEESRAPGARHGGVTGQCDAATLAAALGMPAAAANFAGHGLPFRRVVERGDTEGPTDRFVRDRFEGGTCGRAAQGRLLFRFLRVFGRPPTLALFVTIS